MNLNFFLIFYLLSLVSIILFIWAITNPTPLIQTIKFILNPKSSFSIGIIALVGYLTIVKTLADGTEISDMGLLFIVLGLTIFHIGFVFGIWAKFVMSKYWGYPASLDKKRQKEIVRYGPFAVSRHPIYLAILLMFIGFFLTLRSPFIISIPIIFFPLYKSALAEEKLLEQHFGKKYTDYKKKVPRWLKLNLK